MLIKPEPNDIYPTDPSLDHFWQRAKSQLPITDVNTLFALINIHKNTLLQCVETSKANSNEN